MTPYSRNDGRVGVDNAEVRVNVVFVNVDEEASAKDELRTKLGIYRAVDLARAGIVITT